MIKVQITEKGIRMEGHAGHVKEGQDIVCAAISALTCSLINALEDLTANRIRAETGSGWTLIQWEKLDEFGRLLVDAWYLAIMDIHRERPCIEIR